MITRNSDGTYVLPELPYSINALEPYIDARTMEIHHDKHHAGYANKLNDALRGNTELLDLDLVSIFANLGRVPENLRDTVRNNGGGFYNHALFWRSMSPQGGGQPAGAIDEAIRRDFTDFDSFRDRFSKAAITRFGSGWAWLVTDRKGQLTVGSTPNQDNPLMFGVAGITGIPILGLDVWEHAYYLHYQNRRADYVKAWWNLVDWQRVDELYRLAIE